MSVSTGLLGTNQWLSAVDTMWREKWEDWAAVSWLGASGNEGRRDKDKPMLQPCQAEWRRQEQKALFKVISHVSVTALWRQTQTFWMENTILNKFPSCPSLESHTSDVNKRSMNIQFARCIFHCRAKKLKCKVFLLQWEIEREKEKDHKETHCLLDLSQPVGDSVWGEKSWGEQREGKLPTLYVRKLIKLLAHCEGGEDLRMGLSLPQEAPLASKQPDSLKHIFHRVIQTGQRWPFRSLQCLSLQIAILSLYSFSLFRKFRISFCQRKSNLKKPSAGSITVPCVSCDEFFVCVEDIKKENTMHHNAINSARNWWRCLQCTDSQQCCL